MDKLELEQKRKAAKVAADQSRIDAQEKIKFAKYPKYVDMPENSGNAEKDSEADLTELQKGFRNRAKEEGNRFRLATDTEYWGVLCFQTRAQRDAFFTSLDLDQFGDSRYYDGNAIAKAMGVTLPEESVKYTPSPRIDKSWLEFTD
jgi:hypothetical protein